MGVRGYLREEQGHAMPLGAGRTRVAVTLPVEIAEWLRLQADHECRTPSSLVHHLIRRYRQEVEGNAP